MTAQKKTIEQAINLLNERLLSTPDYPIFKSINEQLKYLNSVIDGTVSGRAELKKIILGVYAVREFEESDPELYRALIDCQNIATQLSKGKQLVRTPNSSN